MGQWMKAWKRKLARRKVRRGWRKVPRAQFPLRYTGADQPMLRGLPGMLHGTPVAPVAGPKGTRGAIRVVDPVGIERSIHRKDIEYR